MPVEDRRRGQSVLLGLANGSVGMVQLRANGEFSNIWSLEDSKRSSVTCLQAFDVTKDGVKELVVGRSDGRVEVFSQDSSGGTSAPSRSFCRDLGESVRGLDCGFVNTAEFSEVVVATYSGKVVSFTAEPVMQRAQDDSYGRSTQTVNNENRIKHLRKELEGLKQKVDKEREKLRRSTPAAAGGTAVAARPPVDFYVIHSLSLDPGPAAYVLTVELQSAIDVIVVRSPVFLEIVESEVGTAVVSVSPAHLLSASSASGASTGGGAAAAVGGDEDRAKFIATFRCQANEKRVSIVLRPTEGEFGDLSLTVVAATEPKAAKIVRLPIKPLSLHRKLHEADLSPADRDRPRNRARFAGNMGLLLLHEWVQALFPEVPPNLEEEATEQRLAFKNTFTGAVSTVEYRRNEIIFESESASVISIAKETVTRLANYRRIKLEESLSPSEPSIGSFLSLIRPRLEHQISLARKMELLDALQEITMQETDTRWLAPEFADMVRDQETIRKEFKSRARSLEYLCGIVTDLFVDWNRMRGVDARHRAAEVQQLLLAPDFSFEALVALVGSAPARKK